MRTCQKARLCSLSCRAEAAGKCEDEKREASTKCRECRRKERRSSTERRPTLEGWARRKSTGEIEVYNREVDEDDYAHVVTRKRSKSHKPYKSRKQESGAESPNTNAQIANAETQTANAETQT